MAHLQQQQYIVCIPTNPLPPFLTDHHLAEMINCPKKSLVYEIGATHLPAPKTTCLQLTQAMACQWRPKVDKKENDEAAVTEAMAQIVEIMLMHYGWILTLRPSPWLSCHLEIKCFSCFQSLHCYWWTSQLHPMLTLMGISKRWSSKSKSRMCGWPLWLSENQGRAAIYLCEFWNPNLSGLL